ncbi:alanine racemase C-terminal domain-containing protein, partial [Chloroflexota bacterium]
IRGVICMDQCVVDVTDIPSARVGDEVTIIGAQGNEEITVSEVAQLSKTIHYEVLVRLPTTLPRIYLLKERRNEQK